MLASWSLSNKCRHWKLYNLDFQHARDHPVVACGPVVVSYGCLAVTGSCLLVLDVDKGETRELGE